MSYQGSELAAAKRAIDSMREELEAMYLYRHRAQVSAEPELRAILQHHRAEETQHFVMLLEWLRQHDPALQRAIQMSYTQRNRHPASFNGYGALDLSLLEARPGNASSGNTPYNAVKYEYGPALGALIAARSGAPIEGREDLWIAYTDRTIDSLVPVITRATSTGQAVALVGDLAAPDPVLIGIAPTIAEALVLAAQGAAHIAQELGGPYILFDPTYQPGTTTPPATPPGVDPPGSLPPPVEPGQTTDPLPVKPAGWRPTSTVGMILGGTAAAVALYLLVRR